MLLINYAHPLTDAHRAQIETIVGAAIDRLIAIPVQLDHARPFSEQAIELADAAGLTPTEWQSAPLGVVPPGLNYATAALLAELHGRMGHFPALVRLRPVPGSLPTVYEVGEVIDLQAARDDARRKRV